MNRKVICTECPMGCEISVEVDDGRVLSISGNTCPRGKVYAENEITCPKRVLTTTVKCKNGCLVSVKTDAPVNKSEMLSLMQKINQIIAKTPLQIGDVIVENLCEGVNLIATSTVKN